MAADDEDELHSQARDVMSLLQTGTAWSDLRVPGPMEVEGVLATSQRLALTR